MDGEDRPDADVDVDVRGSVERVEGKRVFAREIGLGHLDRILDLLRGHDADLSRPPQDLDDGLVRKVVELHHLFALDVRATGHAQDIGETGHIDLGRDDLARDGDLVEKLAEVAGGLFAGALRVLALLAEDVMGEGGSDL